MSVPSEPGQPSTVELMSQLSAQTTRLVRDEMRLAQKELQESVRHAGIGAGLISVAGLLAVLGSATVVAALVAALSLVLPVWAAAAIVAAALFAGRRDRRAGQQETSRTGASSRGGVHRQRETRYCTDQGSSQ